MKLKETFPIVGLGASAGGLAALKAFFGAMPPDVDPAMAFVLVQHLSPDHVSMLAELIQRTTRMHVFQAGHGMQVHINCVYVIPPNRDMAITDGVLQLSVPLAARNRRLPIDFFFHSLALDQRQRAIAIVLSGTGSDGSAGIHTIKDSGGMVIAQTPASCEFDNMPSSAIATGLVDYELRPQDMPEQLMACLAHGLSQLPHPESIYADATGRTLEEIFKHLHQQTGHDFADYKPGVMHRRIWQRMVPTHLTRLEDYASYLQQTPAESALLLGALLSGKSRFFADAAAFETFEKKAVPKLFKDWVAGTPLRVWCVGCATGEEAYSIAILLLEHLQTLPVQHPVQVLATDIDTQALAVARAGIYPKSIAADMAPERLARFFTATPDGTAYQVNESLRKMLVFSVHNVVSDPPLSGLDLISCRNLLVYLSDARQTTLVTQFHAALNPGGLLFLGLADTAVQFDASFLVLSKNSKLFQRKSVGKHVQSTGPGPLPSLREVTEQTLLQQVAPVGALVNAEGDILYMHGRSGMFLEPTPGVSGTNNIVKMARVGLGQELSDSLNEVVKTQKPVSTLGVSVKTDGHFTPVDLTVCPAAAEPPATLIEPLYLVILKNAPPAPADPVLTEGTP